MIGIISLNTSLDKIYMVDKFSKGEVTRVKKVINMAGGKAIHVANICHELDIPYKILGLIAGANGEKIKTLLDQEQMHYEFITLSQGDTRICLNIISAEDQSQTEFLESGLAITPEEKALFMKSFHQLCGECSIIVISGSGYLNMDNNFYGELCSIAQDYHCKVIIDASGELLSQSLAAKPQVIKPNKDEVKFLANGKDNFALIKDLLKQGIELPIISLGAQGALAGYKNKLYQLKNPKVDIINCVGSGDSFIGGIAIGLHENYTIQDTLKLACACGTANTLQLESGRVAKADVYRLLAEIKIQELPL